MVNSSSFIDSLRNPDAYPHETSGTIECVETHISWVLLAGDYAYKIKKPTKNTFLDYSTLALRKRFCEEELRLNQRFAQEIYLDVVPIMCEGEKFSIDGTGSVVEFAVKMHRFPSEALLSHRLVEGLVDVHQVRELAAHVAAFHACAEVASPSSHWGSPEMVLAEALDNFQAIQSTSITRVQDPVALLEHWTRDCFRSIQSKLTSRKRQQHIRECHGDLHLNNIVFWNGKFIPFDGIEFNDAFRIIDTLSDAIFTAADFCIHGRKDFANSFLNAYLESSGDYDAISLERWYEVYRLMVRTKVAVLRADQTSVDSPEHAQANREIDNLLALAEQLTHAHTESPGVWITYGVSGSGKTTGSEQLVQRHGALRIRADVERKRLAGLKPLDRPSPAQRTSLYSGDMSVRTYQRLAELTECIVQAGKSVIVDATFLRKADRVRFRELADSLNVPFHILVFDADHSVLRKRIAERNAGNSDASDADLDVLESQLVSREHLDADELPFSSQVTD